MVKVDNIAWHLARAAGIGQYPVAALRPAGRPGLGRHGA
jgi:hypothetical protein